MTLSITADGIDVTDYCDLPSLKVSEDILNDTWEFDVSITIPKAIIKRPYSNTEIIMTNGATREFAGVIATHTENQIDPYIFRYDVVAGNYKAWFDRHLVAEQYPQQDANLTVKGIVTGYCPGFTTNNVQTAPVVPAQQLDYKAPSSSIKSLADLLSWNFYIDYEKDVHFYFAESIPSPLPNNTLNADTDLINYGDLVLEEDGTQVKNRIFAKGFQIMSSVQVPFTFTGDGQTTTFTLPQIPAGTSDKYMSVSIGNTLYNVVPDIASGLPGEGGPAGNINAYISVGNRTVRFDVAPTSGASITGAMYYKYSPVYTQDDPTLIQQEAAREGTDGVYEYAVQDPRMSGDTTSLAQARCEYLLAKYGTPVLTGTLVSFTPGWRAGQFFYLNSALRMGGIQGKKMYVAKCDKIYATHPLNGDPVIQYTLTISDRPYLV